MATTTGPRQTHGWPSATLSDDRATIGHSRQAPSLFLPGAEREKVATLVRRLLLGLQLAAVGVLIVTSVLGGLRIVERLAAPQPRRPAVTDRVTPARLPPETADFVVWVKAQIPLPAEFSIVDANGKCPGSAKNFWLIYMLLPRTLSCDVDTQYRIYFQSHPPTDNQLPAGTRIFTFRREMHLMELPADRAG